MNSLYEFEVKITPRNPHLIGLTPKSACAVFSNRVGRNPTINKGTVGHESALSDMLNNFTMSDRLIISGRLLQYNVRLTGRSPISIGSAR